ncbi:SRPBCC domain-containing protein [Amycolatopsis sp. OK19-0408]|uniref:SRPBCC domain-containing protein n=1 Tax=Amycolatopsis iheyensis TaxID=2945988 RepID=A0A9X2SJQ1_9PSEU|nr:SRPBCC domain-containing protein [Amycolatopsis iheyensis]MCR6483071.1 SRPBCC domain-containing protein [Amycolatopsis iheyensis]
MSGFEIVRDYPHPRALVWHALTDPALVPKWTSTGRGGRPEGFVPRVGTKFRFVGRPVPGWDGVVRCEVLAVEEPELLGFSWRNQEADTPSTVTCQLEETPAGTRLTYRHTGFQGVGGFFMARLLHRIRRRMLTEGLPDVLAETGA